MPVFYLGGNIIGHNEYETRTEMERLINDIQSCQLCAQYLSHGVRPVVQLASSAQLLIIGQAPGRKVHETGVPWNDPSGERLRDWLQIDKAVFYNSFKVAIMPMGFCYPGKGISGDLPPRKECAPQWHPTILQALPNVKLTLLIGQYAQNYYLKNTEFGNEYHTLTERVKHTKTAINNVICLPHPSPRNQIWLKKNPWFESDILPYLRSQMRQLDFMS